MRQPDLFARPTALDHATILMRGMGCSAPKQDERHGDWTAWARCDTGVTCFYGAANLTRLVLQARWLTGRGPFPAFNREYQA